MTATIDPEVLRATRRVIGAYLADHSVRHTGAVLGVDMSTISRTVTAVTDGHVDHALKWTAGQMVAMARDDAHVLGALIALSVDRDATEADQLGTVSALLSTAQEATAAVSAASPGGTAITDRERRALVATYLRTIQRLACAVRALQPAEGV